MSTCLETARTGQRVHLCKGFPKVEVNVSLHCNILNKIKGEGLEGGVCREWRGGVPGKRWEIGMQMIKMHCLRVQGCQRIDNLVLFFLKPGMMILTVNWDMKQDWGDGLASQLKIGKSFVMWTCKLLKNTRLNTQGPRRGQVKWTWGEESWWRLWEDRLIKAETAGVESKETSCSKLWRGHSYEVQWRLQEPEKAMLTQFKISAFKTLVLKVLAILKKYVWNCKWNTVSLSFPFCLNLLGLFVEKCRM